MFSNYNVDKGKNKVYINPNFNRPPVNNYPMHVNPRFPHLLTSIPPNSSNMTRIHINPNFMKPKSVDVVKVGIPITNISFIQHKIISSHSGYLHLQEQSKIENPMLAIPGAKSRYGLVSENVNIMIDEPVFKNPKTTIQINKYKSVPLNDIKRKQNVNTVSEEPLLEKPKTTIQINKYKSVPLNDIKRRLDNPRNAISQQVNTPLKTQLENQLPSTNKNCTVSTTNIIKRNKFKLVNNKAQVVKNAKMKTRPFINKNKKVLLNQLRLYRIKGSLRKNNIPCPTFRKFGKCLRKEHGNCEFLHDKKHVSICRKFIKGLCHDKDCLLSHDLTMKKMPTCYFYLKGTCTKPECPYLHVKLNEKVTVCPDFLRGYCERGSKCLQRHSNMRSHSRQKVNSLVTRSSSSQNNSKFKVKKLDSINKTTSVGNRQLTEKNTNNLDRYYQEHKDGVNATEICEVIKPTRCKLGLLPSFIQL